MSLGRRRNNLQTRFDVDEYNEHPHLIGPQRFTPKSPLREGNGLLNIRVPRLDDTGGGGLIDLSENGRCRTPTRPFRSNKDVNMPYRTLGKRDKRPRKSPCRLSVSLLSRPSGPLTPRFRTLSYHRTGSKVTAGPLTPSGKCRTDLYSTRDLK